jgi:hypothetical protein
MEWKWCGAGGRAQARRRHDVRGASVGDQGGGRGATDHERQLSNVDRQTRTLHTEGSSSGPRVRGQVVKTTPT